ncbi:hypothetical protein AAMO2058_001149300 [Amorphochlora amoebiformis]
MRPPCCYVNIQIWERKKANVRCLRHLRIQRPLAWADFVIPKTVNLQALIFDGCFLYFFSGGPEVTFAPKVDTTRKPPS